MTKRVWIAIVITMTILVMSAVVASAAPTEKKDYIVPAELKKTLINEGCTESGKYTVTCSVKVGIERGLVEDKVILKKDSDDLKNKLKTETKAIKNKVKSDVDALKNKVKTDVTALKNKLKGNKNQPVVVVVIDTGVDAKHPELKGKVIGGKSFVDDNPFNDGYNHGTAVAGEIAARGLKIEYQGVDPNALIISGKVFDSNGIGDWSGIIDALNEFKCGLDGVCGTKDDPKVFILSLSGGNYPTGNCDNVIQQLTDAIRDIIANGGTVYAAAGNDGEKGPGIPACITGVISVAGIDKDGNWASFSAVGDRVDVTALAVEVPIIKAGGGYDVGYGTSFSAPYAAGAGALLFEAEPSATPIEVQTALFATARDLGTPGWDPYYGWGAVNPEGAVRAI